jgi:signal transduction histidine kinase
METTTQTQTPDAHSQLTHTLEMYLGELLAQHEQLVEEDREKVVHIANAVHNMRGTITTLNLRLYLLEHSSPEQHPRHLAGLKQVAEDLTKMVSEVLDEAHRG